MPKPKRKSYRVRINSLSDDLYWNVPRAEWTTWSKATRFGSQALAESVLNRLNREAGKTVAAGIF